MAELQWKPCPFCGGTDIRYDRHPGAGRGMHHQGQDVFSMCCYDCGGTVPNRYSLKLVNDAWNRRPDSPSAAASGQVQPAVQQANDELVRAAKAVAFSNGFDAAYPDKLEALRAAIAKATGSQP